MNPQYVSLERAKELVEGGKEEILYLLENEVRVPSVALSEVRELHEKACIKLLSFGDLGFMDLLKVRYCPHIPRALQEKAKALLDDSRFAAPLSAA